MLLIRGNFAYTLQRNAVARHVADETVRVAPHSWERVLQGKIALRVAWEINYNSLLLLATLKRYVAACDVFSAACNATVTSALPHAPSNFQDANLAHAYCYPQQYVTGTHL